jgi:RHS repeat-associated protein
MKIRRNRVEPTAEATVTVNNQPVSRYNEYVHKALGVDKTQQAVHEELHIVGVRKNAGPDGADVVTEETGHAFVPKTPEVFTHDADGNLTSDGRWTYTWDAENRLIAMESGTGVPPVVRKKLEFVYDFQSRRISKKVYEWNGASGEWQVAGDLRFIYDGWNLVVELDATLAPVRTHTWGLDLSGSEQGAGGVGGLLFTTTHAPAASTRFVSFDGNGNVSALLNVESGVTSAEYEYDPFGETIRATGPLAKENPFRFSTKYADDETGLVYYGYRYYAPGMARWLSRDPIDELGGINLYLALANDPINLVDPLGLAEWRLDLTGHGKPHIQLGDYRWDARTLRPVTHKVTPPPLTRSQIEEIRKAGIFDRLLKNVRGSIVEEAAEEVLREARGRGTRCLTRRTARELTKSILKKIPVVLIIFAAEDYAEGGIEKAAKNAIIPAELIEEAAVASEARYREWVENKSSDIIKQRCRCAGFESEGDLLGN